MSAGSSPSVLAAAVEPDRSSYSSLVIRPSAYPSASTPRTTSRSRSEARSDADSGRRGSCENAPHGDDAGVPEVMAGV